LLCVSSRDSASDRTTPVKLRSGGTAGDGKTTHSDTLTARAKHRPTATTSTSPSEAAVVRLPRRRPAAKKSTAAVPRHDGPRRGEPAQRTKRTCGAGVSTLDTSRRRRPDSAITSRRIVRGHATTAKPAPRKRSRDGGSRAYTHPRSTAPNRTRQSDSSSSERGGPSDAPRGLLSRSLDAVVEWLKTHVHRLLDAVRDRGEVLTGKIQEWMDTLVEAVAHGGAGMNAGLEGIRAALMGKNPVWAAIKGLVSGLSAGAKVALVLVLVFGLLLGPVLLVVLLLVLVVAALVAAVRAAAE
jgi:hypothetical protein